MQTKACPACAGAAYIPIAEARGFTPHLVRIGPAVELAKGGEAFLEEVDFLLVDLFVAGLGSLKGAREHKAEKKGKKQGQPARDKDGTKTGVWGHGHLFPSFCRYKILNQ